MKCRILLSVLVFFIAGLALNLQAKTNDFIGVWENVDPTTRNITRLVISASGTPNVLKVRTFGQCHPTDCDWGTEKLYLYGASITDDDYQFATAIYDQNFAVSVLALEFLDDGRIALDSYRRFAGGDRQYYHSFDLFHKAPGGGCPDLVVQSIEKPVWDNINKRSVIKAVIQNVGTAPAAQSLARLMDPSTPQSTGAPYNDVQNVPALAPGATHAVTFTLPYWVYNPDADFDVTADYKDMVKECDETNNKQEFHQIG